METWILLKNTTKKLFNIIYSESSLAGFENLCNSQRKQHHYAQGINTFTTLAKIF